MLTRMSRNFTIFIFLLLASFLLTNCSQDVGDLDKTSEGKLQKSLLSGEFYFLRTVVDKSTDLPSAELFVGMTTPMMSSELVKFRITEDYLEVVRAIELADDQEKPFLPDGMQYEGVVLAKFRISSHFDIIRDYNPATGEQSNVIVENTSDRPWYEREYMRVDWNSNEVRSSAEYGSVEFYDMSAGSTGFTDPSHPYSIELGIEDENEVWHNYKTEKEKTKQIMDDIVAYNQRNQTNMKNGLDYLSFVLEFIVKPSILDFGSYGQIPGCWLMPTLMDKPPDCSNQVVFQRFSFLKKKDTGYIPRNYPEYEVATDKAGQTIRKAWDNEKSEWLRIVTLKEYYQNQLNDGKITQAEYDKLMSDNREQLTNYMRFTGEPLGTILPQDIEEVKVPLDMKFGFFHLNRAKLDTKNGTYYEKDFNRAIHRYNIWKNPAACVDPANEPQTHKNCEIKQIMWYMRGETQDTPWMVDAAKETIRQWNTVFSDIVKFRKGIPEGADYDSYTYEVMKLGDNGIVMRNKETKEKVIFYREGLFSSIMEDIIPQKLTELGWSKKDVIITDERKHYGDPRYSWINFVEENHDQVLGFGPSMPDPITGETISGTVNLYTGHLYHYISDFMQLMKVAKHEMTVDEFLDLDIAADYTPMEEMMDVKDPFDTTQNLPDLYNRFFGPDYQTKIKNYRKMAQTGQLDGVAPRLTPTTFIDSLKKFQRYIEQNPEASAATDWGTDFMNSLYPDIAGSSTQIDDTLNLSKKMTSPQFLGLNTVMYRLASRCILLAGSGDPSFISLWAVIDRYWPKIESGEMTEDQVFYELVKRWGIGILIHEMGHVIGLRHNFAGSSDSLNYYDCFWDIIEKNPANHGELLSFNGLTEDQIHQGAYDCQTAAIMDYGEGFFVEHSLGKYDAAAIKFGYGEMVDTFKNRLDETKIPFLVHKPEKFTIDRVFFDFVHASDLPRVFSNCQGGSACAGWKENLRERVPVSYKQIVEQMTLDSYNGIRSVADDYIQEVPYRFCTDMEGYYGASTKCRIWNAGFDAHEEIRYKTNYYDFRSFLRRFPRGKTYLSDNPFMFSGFDFAFRYANIISENFQHWIGEQLLYNLDYLNQVIWDREVAEMLKDNTPGIKEYLGQSEVNWFTHPNGGGGTTAGVIDGFNYFFKNISRPNFGSYIKYFDFTINLDDPVNPVIFPTTYWYVSEEKLRPCNPGELYLSGDKCSNATVPLGLGGHAFTVTDDFGLDDSYNRVKIRGDWDNRLGFILGLTYPGAPFRNPKYINSGMNTYVVGVANMLPDLVYSMVGSFLTSDASFSGWRMRPDGKVIPPNLIKQIEYFDPSADYIDQLKRGESEFPYITPQEYGNAINTYLPWTLYMMNFGYDTLYYDLCRVWRAGDAVAPDPNNQATALTMTSFMDLLNGQVYYALRHPKFYSPGAKLLEKAQIMWVICLAQGLATTELSTEDLANIKTIKDIQALAGSAGFDLAAASSCMQSTLSNLETVRRIANALEPMVLDGVMGW